MTAFCMAMILSWVPKAERKELLTQHAVIGPQAAYLRTYVIDHFAECESIRELCGVAWLGWARKLVFILLVEMELTFWSFWFGIRHLFDATTHMATISLQGGGKEDSGLTKQEAEKQVLNLRVMLFIEAIYESTPQVIVSTLLAHLMGEGDINYTVLYLSILCSSIGIINALYHFAKHYERMLEVLVPTAEALKLQVRKLITSAGVSTTALGGAIRAAFDKGTTAAELTDGIRLFLRLRAEDAKAATVGVQALRDAGYVARELKTAGVPGDAGQGVPAVGACCGSGGGGGEGAVGEGDAGGVQG